MQYKGIWINSQIHLPAIVQYQPVREFLRAYYLEMPFNVFIHVLAFPHPIS